jgi:hypothetical protein
MYNIKHYTSAFGKAGMVQLFRKNYQRAAFLMMFLLAGQIAFAQTNDHCSTAEPFPTIGTDGECYSVTGNLQNATVSPLPPCYGDYSNDLWYTFTAPEDVESLAFLLMIDWENSDDVDPVIEIYESCNGEIVDCYNSYYGYLTSLTDGEDYVVRVKNYDEEGHFAFELCLKTILPSVNDECENAIDLGVVPPFGECSPVLINSVGSTYDGGDYCSGSEPYNDVFYSFTLPEDASAVYFNMEYRYGHFYMFKEIWDACGGEILLCTDEDIFGVEGLTPGGTYIVKFQHDNEFFGSGFDLCLTTYPALAPNSSCDGAIALPALSETQCANAQMNTLASTFDGVSDCSGYDKKAFWHSFYLPEDKTSILYSMNSIGGDSDLMIELWDECSGELIDCYDAEQGTFTGLEGGHTYLLCTYTYYGYYESIYELCVLLGPDAPENDSCVNALPIPTLTTDGSCTNVSGTTAGSSSENLPSCYYTPDNDVWFTFTVPAGQTSIRYSISTESEYDYVGLQLFEECEVPTEHDCLFGLNGVFNDLQEETTYLLRVYSDSYGSNINFDLCLATVPTTYNDDICDAVVLTAGSNCEYITSHNLGATDQDFIDYPNCGYYLNSDVWFKVAVPESGAVDIKTTDMGINDATMEVYLAISCEDELVQLDCNDDSESSNDDYYMPRITLYDLTPGDTVYIRIYGYDDAMGYFGICVSEPCAVPYDFDVEVNNNTADILWAFDGDGIEFNWELRTEGMGGSGEFGLVTSGVAEVGQTSLTVSDLNYESIYYFFVQSPCDDMEWSYPMYFYSGVMAGCTDEEACNYNPLAVEDDGSCSFDAILYYRDADGDGYGNPEDTILECHAPEGYVSNNTDCDDNNANDWTMTNNVIEAILPSDICNNASALELSVGTPVGTWSGEGVTDGVLDPSDLTPGTLTLTYTLDEVSTCWLNASINVNTTIVLCAGVDEVNAHRIIVYPTLANDYITIQGEALTEAIIMDMNGKVLKSVSLNAGNRIAVADMAAGVYFINVKSIHTSITTKFMVTK